MEHEIRQNIPIMYYNIWDDLPDQCIIEITIEVQIYYCQYQNKPMESIKEYFLNMIMVKIK